MKILRSALLVTLGLLACGRAAVAEPEQRTPLTPKQIEELVSPIALYPDPLVALILPAATRPSDIVLAARFLENGGDPERAATEPWDESVKALARYREVVDYLDENLAWTRSLGESFLDQPVAVMNAIQAVRARAREAGLLKDTSEQEIIVEDDEIRILPANPTVIYVPRYDPEILYVSSFPSYYPGPFLTFGIGYGIGAWLSYDCDWRYHSVRIAHRPAYWYRQPDWRGRHFYHPPGATAWQRWTPPARHDRRFDRPSNHSGVVLHPNRPRRDASGPAPYAAPSTHFRDARRPDAGQSSFRPEPPRRRDEASQPRNDRTSPRRHAPAIADSPAMSQTLAGQSVANRPPPAYQRPPTQVHQPRVHNDSAASPRRDSAHQSSVRPVPTHAPPAPRMAAPPPERPQRTMQSPTPGPRNEGYDRSAYRQRPDRNEPRRQEN